jgi:threonine synthase
MTRYISTRGPGTPQSFVNVLMQGMVPDGGLYIPDVWPTLDRGLLGRFSGLEYAEIAYQVFSLFTGGDPDPASLRKIIAETYSGKNFNHPAIAPLAQVGPNAWLLDLARGPTLSFKDYALQLIGRLFDHVLGKINKRVTICGATSGDTGSAAIAACRSCRNIDIFILHPKDRVSDVQRRQMTTVDAPNVFNIAVEGTFDDCQALVKALFADQQLRDEINLSAVNSINWARIAAQIVYYVVAATALGSPDRPISFTVPTGNFGNVFAGWSARSMGLPIERLVIGSNRNDILTRFFETGEMKQDKVQPSLSPSMDIQISSNFERYLCELTGRDFDRVRTLMEEFSKTGKFKLPADLFEKAKEDFRAIRCSDEETLAMMKECYGETGMLVDPHTAVALHAARQAVESSPAVPMVVLSTAHPAKFPDAVEKATGVRPSMPESLARLMKKPEFLHVLPNDLKKLKSFLRANAGEK